jgi:hypothetical protein
VNQQSRDPDVPIRHNAEGNRAERRNGISLTKPTKRSSQQNSLLIEKPCAANRRGFKMTDWRRSLV